MPAPKVKSVSVPSALPNLRGFDYVEVFVGNVRQATHYYETVWGFEPIAFRGLESGSNNEISMAMKQGNISIRLTGAVSNSSGVAEHLHLHGEGTARVAFSTDNVGQCYETVLKQGAVSVHDPTVTADECGRVSTAEIKTPFGISHVFIDRSEYTGPFLPGFRPVMSKQRGTPLVTELDHIAIAVEAGTLEESATFYKEVFGFETAHREDVATELSGMNSHVVQHLTGSCKFPLVEPVVGKKKSQVQEFLSFHGGPGVQHLAFSTPDIVSTVRELRKNAVEFLKIPESYYSGLERRVGSLGAGGAAIRELGILVDHDEWGQLLQIFARPIQDRPTSFFEVIERRGALGFGGGNIRALFEAIEREQALRGTL
jgi:4-hydroxyphenylpyruvate dioxygenase